MKRYFLFLTYLLSAVTLLGQTKNDYKTLLYQITPAEYIAIYQGEKIGQKHLHTQVKNTVSDFTDNQFGYFIKAYPKQEQLQLELIAQTSFSIILLNNQKDFALRVIDSMGITISNAAVYWDKKLLPFDAETNSYRLKKWKKSTGIVLVKTNREVAFL